MSQSKSSPLRARAAERRVQGLELRKAGLTFEQIGARLGCTPQAAHRAVTLELQRLNEKRAETASEVCRLEMERLDAMLSAAWEKALKGSVREIDTILAIMARRARLLGLDAPERKELTGAAGGPLRFCLEQAIKADEELSEWRNARQAGSSSLEHGGVEVPEGPKLLPGHVHVDLRRDQPDLEAVQAVDAADGSHRHNRPEPAGGHPEG
jgi:hypothetical protein